MAFGNSDGDLQMLQWTTLHRGDGDRTPRLGLIVHHTDDEREWAYDRQSHIGKLDRALDEASRPLKKSFGLGIDAKLSEAIFEFPRKIEHRLVAFAHVGPSKTVF